MRHVLSLRLTEALIDLRGPLGPRIDEIQILLTRFFQIYVPGQQSLAIVSVRSLQHVLGLLQPPLRVIHQRGTHETSVDLVAKMEILVHPRAVYAHGQDELLATLRIEVEKSADALLRVRFTEAVTALEKYWKTCEAWEGIRRSFEDLVHQACRLEMGNKVPLGIRYLAGTHNFERALRLLRHATITPVRTPHLVPNPLSAL